MKRNTMFLVLLAVLLIIAAVWYYMQPVQYCDVVYSQQPQTQSLVVSCDDAHCNKTCYLNFRKKASSNDWTPHSDSHTFDTTAWEYQCKCK